MNKKKATVAGLGAAAAALLGAALVPTIVNADLPTSGPHMDLGETGLISQTITLSSPTIAAHGDTETSHGGGSGNPVVKVDSVFVPAPYPQTVDLGSSHSVSFAPVLPDPVTQELYVTTAPQLPWSAITDDVTTHATYARIDDLIESSAVDGDPDGTHQLAIRILVTEWRDVQGRLGQAGALHDLQALADDVRATAGFGDMTGQGQVQVINHLQVVYRHFGGVGAV